MPRTELRGDQIFDGGVGREDLNTDTIGKSIITKVIAGTNVTISSTGADVGTGDVTINATGGGGGGGASFADGSVFSLIELDSQGNAMPVDTTNSVNAILHNIDGNNDIQLGDPAIAINDGTYELDANSDIQPMA